MARVSFTDNLRRHIDCHERTVAGRSVREVLEAIFDSQPEARGYILDDQGAVRSHVVIFLNNTPIVDRKDLCDVVQDEDELYIMQALSGG